MDIHALARTIRSIEYAGSPRENREITRVHASNTMSELIAHAASDTLLVTALDNCQLIRVAELMDVPGICLVSNAPPSPDFVAKAAEAGTTILVSPLSLEKTMCTLRDALKLADRTST